MRLPVDTSAASFVTAGPAEPAVDFDTKVQKLDEDRRPVFNVHLFSIGAGGRDVITVKVAGEPKGHHQFTPVEPGRPAQPGQAPALGAHPRLRGPLADQVTALLGDLRLPPGRTPALADPSSIRTNGCPV